MIIQIGERRGSMKKGDYVVPTRHLFPTVYEVTKVCKNGRVLAGGIYLNEDEVRPATEEEKNDYFVAQRAKCITKKLSIFYDALVEDEVKVLEDIFNKAIKRYHNESTHN